MWAIGLIVGALVGAALWHFGGARKHRRRSAARRACGRPMTSGARRSGACSSSVSWCWRGWHGVCRSKYSRRQARRAGPGPSRRTRTRARSLSGLLSRMRSGQTVMNARRSAQRIARPIRKPSDAAGAPFGRNPKGRRRFGGHPVVAGRWQWAVALRRDRRLGLPPKAPPSHTRQQARQAPRLLVLASSRRARVVHLPAAA